MLAGRTKNKATKYDKNGVMHPYKECPIQAVCGIPPARICRNARPYNLPGLDSLQTLAPAIGCKVVPLLLTVPREFDNLHYTHSWWRSNAIRPFETARTRNCSACVTASKRCLECDGGS